MREIPAFDNEDLWFPAHMSAGDSFSRPLAADGAPVESGDADDGIGLPRRPGTGSGGGPRRPHSKKTGGVKASSWLWLTLWGAAALGIASYAARKDVVTEMAQGWLKSQGVPARLHFDRLSLNHASGYFVLGDPQRPDISAGHFDADFSLNPFAGGGQPMARLTRARLDQVDVHLSWKGGKLGFGTLDRLVHKLSVAPKTPGASPKDITIDRVSVVVDSEYGTLRAKGRADLRDGRLSYLALKLPAGSIEGVDGGGDFGGGDILVRAAGDTQLQVEARLTAPRLDLRDGGHIVEGAPAHLVQARGLSLDVSGRIPYRDDGALSGPLDAAVAVASQELRTQGVTVADADCHLKLDGRVRNGVQYDGDAGVAARIGRVTGSGVDADQVAVAADRLNIHALAGSIGVKGPLAVSAGRARRPGVVAVAATLRATRFEWSSDNIGSHADFDGAVGAANLRAGDLVLSNARATISAAADSDAGSGAWHLKAQGDLDGGASYSGLHALAQGRAASDDLVRLDRGLRDFRFHASGLGLAMAGDGHGPADFDLRLRAPVEASLAGGLTLDLTPGAGQTLLASHRPGAFDLTLEGGPRLTLAVSGLGPSPRGGFGGNYAFDGAFTTAPVTLAKVTAKGRFTVADGLAVTLAEPLAFSAQSADLGETFTHLSGTLSQDDGALLRAGASGWRLDGTYKALALEAPKEQLALKDGRGALSAFSIAGSKVVGLKAGLDAAALSDTSPAAAERFHPLALSGTLTQDARALTGRFTAATPNFRTAGKPTPVVAVALDNDNAASRGQLSLRTLNLTFKPGGLQPEDLSQMGTAILAKQVTGPLSFDGAFRWQGRQTSSSGVLKIDGLSFAGAIGTAENLRGEIDFTSLSPLRSEPNQLLGIYRMQLGLPLSDLAMSLQFQGDRIAIEKATVNTPGGPVRLEPTRIAFDPKVPIDGAAAFDGLDFGKIIAATGLSNSMTFEGRLSGRVPFSILGGHITFAKGWMASDGPGNISIKRQAVTGVAASGSLTGDGHAAAAQLQPAYNPFQDLAYQAMEHLHYDQLDAKVNSQPGGVLDTTFHLKGRFTPPQAQKARIGLMDYLNGTWTQKPLKLPSGTPVELYLDVPVNLDEILNSLAQFGK
jgi:hypothetical protein